MGHEHPLGAGRLDGGHESRPVRMVRQREAAVETPPSPVAAQLHPAAGERIGIGAEALEPGARGGGRRRKDEGVAEVGLVPELARRSGRRQGDAGLAIKRVDRLDCAMTHDRPDRGVDMGEHALGLAERIGVEHASPARRGVLAPPGVD